MKEERQAPTGKGRPAAMKTAQAKATPIADIEVVGEDRRLTQIGVGNKGVGSLFSADQEQLRLPTPFTLVGDLLLSKERGVSRNS